MPPPDEIAESAVSARTALAMEFLRLQERICAERQRDVKRSRFDIVDQSFLVRIDSVLHDV